jgi:hypothetical protein
VAIVPNGGDGSTSINIAAQAASPSKENRDMEFTRWLEAQGFVADDLDEKQTASLQAMFDAQSDGTDRQAATVGKDVTAAAVADLRAELAAETARVAAIRTICAGRHPDIEARAIGEGWDATKTELAVIREERPKAPAIHGCGDSKLVASDVIEAALCLSRKHADVEKRFKPEVLEAADRQYRNLGFQQLFMMAAANGYPARPGETIHSGNIREVLSYAFPPRTLQASFSTLSLPGILQNLANKELLVGYTEEDQTWREVATVKSVSDFKEVTSYRLLDDMEYEELPKHRRDQARQGRRRVVHAAGADLREDVQPRPRRHHQRRPERAGRSSDAGRRGSSQEAEQRLLVPLHGQRGLLHVGTQQLHHRRGASIWRSTWPASRARVLPKQPNYRRSLTCLLKPSSFKTATTSTTHRAAPSRRATSLSKATSSASPKETSLRTSWGRSP